MLGCSLKPLSRTPRPTCPLETVCISLLDLVVALTKFLLLFIFSLEETTVQAFSLSQQPSLRAFPRRLFIMSFLGQSRPSCSLVRSENPFLTIYLDDILIYSDNISKHKLHVQEVLHRLHANGLFAHADKCKFHVTSCEYLGYMLSPEGL